MTAKTQVDVGTGTDPPLARGWGPAGEEALVFIYDVGDR